MTSLMLTIPDRGLTLTSPAGSVHLRMDLRTASHYVEADEGYATSELLAVLGVTDQLGLIEDDQEEPELTDTGVRIYFRLSNDPLTAA